MAVTEAHTGEDGVQKTAAVTTLEPVFSFGRALQGCLVSLNSNSATQDNRVTGRVLRTAVSIRRRFEPETFLEFVKGILVPAELPRGTILVDLFQSLVPETPTPMNVEQADKAMEGPEDHPTLKDTSEQMSYTVGSPQEYQTALHDIDLFLTTLGLMALIDRHQAEKTTPLVTSVLEQLSAFPPLHRHDDLLVAKVVFYVGRACELCNRLPSLAGFLMNIYRTATLHHRKMTQVMEATQHMCQAVSMNLILRNFLQTSQYEQAVKFLDKTSFPESLRSNAQHARYLYYLARIHAVRLDYAEGHAKVTQAIRKAPQEGTPAGRGFRLAAYKLSFIIQLLLGDIPDRRLFNQKDLCAGLEPYSQIVQAVRSGDLILFKRVMERHHDLFDKDTNLILIQRLHHNVIRAGLRKIVTSYSCISFTDIAAKLGLEASDDPECIVSKAIADGVIDATVCSDTQTVKTTLHSETQASSELRKAFHGRIAFCLQLHNEAVKAMQYPERENETKIEEAEARRKEHQEQLARAEKDEFEGGDDGDLI